MAGFNGGIVDAVLRVMAVVALVALNVSVICFYGLWQVADTIAVNRAEEHGFDPQQLLPHGTLFWFAAHASLLSLLALDALVIVAWRRARRRRRNPATRSRRRSAREERADRRTRGRSALSGRTA
mgnify:FL=1